MTKTPLYDNLSADYDRFVNWPARLNHELPFIKTQLDKVHAHRILDAACGTGHHAIALAASDREIVGADLSAGMVEQARINAQHADAEVRFVQAGFGELAARAGQNFDALLCLGNSLPHVLDAQALETALHDFAAALRPGGLLFVQNRNFDAVLAQHDRWMGPQMHREPSGEWLFVRFYDFNPDGTLTFNVLTLYRKSDEDNWTQQNAATRLYPLPRNMLVRAVEAAGFTEVMCYGDMSGAPFEPESSGNLILSAFSHNVTN